MTPLDRLRRIDGESPLGRAMTMLSTRLLSGREVVGLSVLFVTAIPIVALSLWGTNQVLFDGALDVPISWPISVFTLHYVWTPRWLYLLVLMAVPALFVAATVLVIRTDGLFPVALAGGGLIFASTLLQGVDPGFVTPIAGGYVMDYGGPGPMSGKQYYHAALAVENPVQFLANFNELQPDLLSHSRTHPPGAVLTFYALGLLFPPALITVVIAITAVTISVPAVYALLSEYVSRDVARYTTYLYLLLPSVQIYYAASLDALVTALIAAAVALFVVRDDVLGTVGSTVCLLAASFLTFTFLFALPALLAYEVVTDRRVRRTAFVLAVLAAAYVLLFVTFDFHYLQSMLTAVELEHGTALGGFPGVANYAVTRLESLAELFLFFTPFLTWLVVRERRHALAHRGAFVLFATAGLTFLAMLGTGAYKTGESARAAMFVYPFLLLPLASYLDDVRPTAREGFVLAALVFGQTYLMQVGGFYFW